MTAEISPAAVGLEHAIARSSAMRIVKALAADDVATGFILDLLKLDAMSVTVSQPGSSATIFALWLSAIFIRMPGQLSP